LRVEVEGAEHALGGALAAKMRVEESEAGP
jgi:hypothetical protein